MEEQKDSGLSPEQAEMKIYEQALDQMGAGRCLKLLFETAIQLAKDSLMLSTFLDIRKEESAIDSELMEEFVEEAKKNIAVTQVACNLAELIVGDTAEYEYKTIKCLELILKEHEGQSDQPTEKE